MRDFASVLIKKSFKSVKPKEVGVACALCTVHLCSRVEQVKVDDGGYMYPVKCTEGKCEYMYTK